MSAKADFTPDEWKLLLQSPLVAGTAVARFNPTMLFFPASAVQEATAAAGPNGNALVKAVVSDLGTSEGNDLAEDGLKAATASAKDEAGFVSKALDSLKAASALLDIKGGQNAAPFKTWLVSLAKFAVVPAPQLPDSPPIGSPMDAADSFKRAVERREAAEATVGQIAAALGVPTPAA